MINIYSVKTAVKNGDIRFVKTEKGILCEDVHSGERVCVHTFEKKTVGQKFVIGIDCGGIPNYFVGLLSHKGPGNGKVFISNDVSKAWQTTDANALEDTIEHVVEALEFTPSLNRGLDNVRVLVVGYKEK